MKVDARFRQLCSWRYRSISFAIVLAMAFCLAAPFAGAQSTGGRIRGTVVDPSGAAVAAAKITLISEATHATRDVQAGAEGEYIFLEVPVGSYEVNAQSPGFKKYVRRGVVLNLNEVVNLDVTLQVGAAVDTIEVTGAPPVVDTTSTQLGAVVNERAVSQLPLAQRDAYQLLQLQPAVQPSPDAIAEFRVLTNTFDAEYGRNSGAVVNVVTKSGSNDFHGNLYEFFRNKGLNARGFFDSQKLDYLQNQFGTTLGGPLKKNKTFFFATYEGDRIRRGSSSDTVAVPSDPERLGDFSADPSFQGTLANANILNN